MPARNRENNSSNSRSRTTGRTGGIGSDPDRGGVHGGSGFEQENQSPDTNDDETNRGSARGSQRPGVPGVFTEMIDLMVPGLGSAIDAVERGVRELHERGVEVNPATGGSGIEDEKDNDPDLTDTVPVPAPDDDEADDPVLGPDDPPAGDPDDFGGRARRRRAGLSDDDPPLSRPGLTPLSGSRRWR